MLTQVDTKREETLAPTERRRGADLLVRILKAAGVSRIYSLSGNQIMPVYDACIDVGIEIVHTRHEAAAVFMADAHSQMTGGLGVALVTAAPGAMNALGALYSASTSESPVLLLTGDSATAQDGRGAFQELDQVSVIAPLVKSSVRVMSVEALSEVLQETIGTALSGRPGPVHLALPFDVLEAEAAPGASICEAMPARDAQDASEARTGVLAEIRHAARPLVLCGPSLSRTRRGDLVDRLAEHLAAPVVVMESPRGLNDPSLGAFGAVLPEADLILSIGKPVDFTLGFGKPSSQSCRWIVIDPEEAEIERARRNLGDRLRLGALAHSHAFANALLSGPSAMASGDRAGWREKVQAAIETRTPPEADEAHSNAIPPQALTAAIQRRLDKAGESVVVCDGGEFGQWAQAGTRGTRRIVNGTSGAIGGSPCYALAAKLARPQAVVYALMGDGTVGFHLAEFETAHRCGAAFVAVVGNDMCWNAEHQIQLRNYGPDRLIGCDLSDARYDLAVAALGGHGEFVTDLADLDDALSRAEASGKVALVNVRIEGRPAPSGAGH